MVSNATQIWTPKIKSALQQTASKKEEKPTPPRSTLLF